ncbi:pterin-4-alpha-carbinolamine dehydratase [Longilinea arvoryzae]|uniref:Putative pterin-4-alpha-carbinolamine dehydratase n=1 Tax=Longilinea arvoryzae TaxID=360412 RepID=A0A0S7BH86_9CHLR|nr:4a-hydroxytetrahydrobiopterin dehydratase [Longilinea arvoryzae]GAP14452.1 pterin-4-alpha-carbinolamine dehydratase [Longilinea arvoryzae]
MSKLSEEKCVPCQGGVPPLSLAAIQTYLPEVPEWQVMEENGDQKIRRAFAFRKYTLALAFAQQVGMLAEAEGHHPTLLIEWGRVTITWWTHKINGLHRNDFIMAARTDGLYRALPAED